MEWWETWYGVLGKTERCFRHRVFYHLKQRSKNMRLYRQKMKRVREENRIKLLAMLGEHGLDLGLGARPTAEELRRLADEFEARVADEQ